MIRSDCERRSFREAATALPPKKTAFSLSLSSPTAPPRYAPPSPLSPPTPRRSNPIRPPPPCPRLSRQIRSSRARRRRRWTWRCQQPSSPPSSPASTSAPSSSPQPPAADSVPAPPTRSSSSPPSTSSCVAHTLSPPRSPLVFALTRLTRSSFPFALWLTVEGGGSYARTSAPAAAAEPEPAEPAPRLCSPRGRCHRLPRARRPARAPPPQLRQHQRPPALRTGHHLQRSQVCTVYFLS